jgi:hypothetical protein
MTASAWTRTLAGLLLAAAAAGSLAQATAGGSWKYRFSDSLYGRHSQVFTVRADSTAGPVVRDTLAAEGEPEAQASFDQGAPKFAVRALAASRALVEAFAYGMEGTPPVTGYPQGSKTYLEWKVTTRLVASEEVKVPAGTFRAQRIVIEGTRPTDQDPFWWPKEAGRFRYTLWYAPEARRYVRARNQSWSMTAAEFSDELVELLEYKPN